MPHCDGATYCGATGGVKERSIYQSRVSLLTFSPPWDVSVDGSPYTVVHAYPNFDPNPGDPGRHNNKAHAQAFLLKENVRIGIRARVLPTTPNVMVLLTELPG